MLRRERAGKWWDVSRKPTFWLLVALLLLITVYHYGDAVEHPAFVASLIANLDLSRDAFGRILYLAPIIWAGFLFGRTGAALASTAALAVMLPRAVFLTESPRDALLEASAVLVVGNLVALSFEALRKERERRIQLVAINQTSGLVSQSLELRRILDSSIDNVRQVMKADAVLVFLMNRQTKELVLTAHEGVSQRFAMGFGRIRVGEGFNGRVAATGEPLLIGDVAEAHPWPEAMKREGIASQLIVPLKSKGEVMGTLCAAVRSRRRFRQDETELLTAIGNQIGVAIENARLYEEQKETAERLRASEERYRELFENAYDAIWVSDLEGHLTAANKTCVALSGYALEELCGLRTTDLLSDDSRQVAEDIEHELLKGEAKGSISEAGLTRRDGTVVVIQLASSLVLSDGRPVAFQHIARDVSKEKQMKENLRFYLQQVTKAQEDERKRIARELHDETIQALVVLSRQLDDLTSGDKRLPTSTRDILENLREQTTSIMDNVRRLSQDLRPAALDRLGLLPALDWLASDTQRRSGIDVKVKAHGVERRLPSEVELLLFRVAQEALRNVWRHSHATHAEVAVRFNGQGIDITVTDNGRGFDIPETLVGLVKGGKLGLAGMQERLQLLNGKLSIDSAPGKGTCVTIEAPV